MKRLTIIFNIPTRKEASHETITGHSQFYGFSKNELWKKIRSRITVIFLTNLILVLITRKSRPFHLMKFCHSRSVQFKYYPRGPDMLGDILTRCSGVARSFAPSLQQNVMINYYSILHGIL